MLSCNTDSNLWPEVNLYLWPRTEICFQRLKSVTKDYNLWPHILNPYNTEIVSHNPWKPKGFFQFEIVVNVLALSAPFEYVMGLRPL